MSKKIYNTTEYRKAHRITAYVSETIKQKIIKAAKNNDKSVSEEAGNALTEVYE